MTDDAKDSLLLFGLLALVVLAVVGLASLGALLSGCHPTIHGPAVSLSTTVQAPCSVEALAQCQAEVEGWRRATQSSVKPSGVVGPQ